MGIWKNLKSAIYEPFTSEFVEGLKQFRQNHATYDEWLQSPYCLDMAKRKAYYEERQCESTVPVGGVSSPEEWSKAHSGPGWDDIRAMIPDATKQTAVKFFGLNLTSVIINNRQVVYSLPVKARTLRVDKEVDQTSTDRYHRLYTAATHDEKADQLCKWVGLFGTAFQSFAYDEKSDRVSRHNLEPWRVLVLPGRRGASDLQDPETMVCILLEDEPVLTQAKDRKKQRDIRPVWQVWWRDLYWYESDPGKPYRDIDLTEKGTNDNPYRTKDGDSLKPILVARDAPSDHIYYPGSGMLIQQNQVIDRQLTAANYCTEYQGFAIPVITGAEVEEVEANAWSPGSPQVYRDPQTQMRFANPNARPSEFLSATRTAARAVARLYAVDPELVDPDTRMMSGVSKAQGRVALAERRKQQFPKWRGYERESYWITAVVWNTHNPAEAIREIDRVISGSLLKPAEEIAVTFAPLAPTADVLSEALSNKTNIDLDLITRADIIAAAQDVDISTAKEIAKEIAKNNREERKIRILAPSPNEGMQGAGRGNMRRDRIGQEGNRPTNDRNGVGGVGTPGGAGNNAIDSDNPERTST
jgi:hypothetical protein